MIFRLLKKNVSFSTLNCVEMCNNQLHKINIPDPLSLWIFLVVFYMCETPNKLHRIFQTKIDYILIRAKKMQQYAGIYLLQNHSTCFGFPSHPSSGVHQTVTAASGTGHSI